MRYSVSSVFRLLVLRMIDEQRREAWRSEQEGLPRLDAVEGYTAAYNRRAEKFMIPLAAISNYPHGHKLGLTVQSPGSNR